MEFWVDSSTWLREVFARSLREEFCSVHGVSWWWLLSGFVWSVAWVRQENVMWSFLLHGRSLRGVSRKLGDVWVSTTIVTQDTVFKA